MKLCKKSNNQPNEFISWDRYYMDSVLIFPNQLFEHHPSFKKERPILLVEDSRFFLNFAFTNKNLSSIEHHLKILKKP